MIPNIPDVEMKSVGSRHSQTEEYDADDLWAAEPRRLQVATTESNANMGTVIQRLQVSAISELKEFSGRTKMKTELVAGSAKSSQHSYAIRRKKMRSVKFLVI